MAVKNYLKVFADGHTEATVEKPSFGEVSATGDYYINGLWYDKLGVVYPIQFTYMAKDDKLATFLVEDEQPVDITFDDDSPSIVQDVIQAKDMVVVDKLKINNTEWLNDGIDYDDQDAIGANPVAKIYPDGTIVGSTDNGDYVKCPNGELSITLEVSGVLTGTTLYFPLEFILAPVAVSNISTSGTTVTSNVMAVTTTSLIVNHNHGSSPYVSVIAKGRWK